MSQWFHAQLKVAGDLLEAVDRNVSQTIGKPDGADGSFGRPDSPQLPMSTAGGSSDSNRQEGSTLFGGAQPTPFTVLNSVPFGGHLSPARSGQQPQEAAAAEPSTEPHQAARAVPRPSIAHAGGKPTVLGHEARAGQQPTPGALSVAAPTAIEPTAAAAAAATLVPAPPVSGTAGAAEDEPGAAALSAQAPREAMAAPAEPAPATAAPPQKHVPPQQVQQQQHMQQQQPNQQQLQLPNQPLPPLPNQQQPQPQQLQHNANAAKLIEQLRARLSAASAENEQLEEMLRHEEARAAGEASAARRLAAELAALQDQTAQGEAQMQSAIAAQQVASRELSQQLEVARRMNAKLEAKVAALEDANRQMLETRSGLEGGMLDALKQQVTLPYGRLPACMHACMHA